MKLLSSSPPPVSSVSASATSATTSDRRSACPCLSVVPPRPLSFSITWRSPRELCSAGTSPKRTPVTSATVAVNSTTVPSMRQIRRRAGCSPDSAPPARGCWRPPGTVRARRPPTASIRLSTSSPRTSTPRSAPSAVRIATSFCRDAARASSRFATFTHAMSSTSPTAPSSTSSAGRMFPVFASVSVVRPSVQSGEN